MRYELFKAIVGLCKGYGLDGRQTRLVLRDIMRKCDHG